MNVVFGDDGVEICEKNAGVLFVASEDVDEACESRHLEYWDPDDAGTVEAQNHGKVTFEHQGAFARLPKPA